MATPKCWTAATFAALTLAGTPLRAAELDITGSWQINTDCGDGVVTTNPGTFSEDVPTGAVAGGFTTSTSCGTIFLGGGLRVIASCEYDVRPGLVSGTSYAQPANPLELSVAVRRFATPFDFFSCAGASPAATIITPYRTTGTITATDGAGRATRIEGTTAVQGVTFRDPAEQVCLDLPTFANACTFVMLRNAVETGTAQTVEPLDGVTITFDTVAQPGTVDVTLLDSAGGELPASFQLLATPLFYEVRTDAVVTGDRVVCFPYPDADDDGVVDGTSVCETPSSACGAILQVLHEEGGSFVDRTDSVDAVGNRICARVQSFSPFVLGGGPICGNGVVEALEECDAGAGNGASGGCCSATCAFRPAGTACAADGTLCTTDACDGAGQCAHLAEPDNGCKDVIAAKKSKLVMKRLAPAGGAVRWSWSKGDSTTLAELGDPTVATPYELCVYETLGPPTLALALPVPAGSLCGTAPCWRPAAAGFGYKDRGGTAGGVTSLKLRSGNTGLVKLLLKAKGPNVPSLPLPAALPLRAELRSTNACWGATYAGATRNDGEGFVAVGD